MHRRQASAPLDIETLAKRAIEADDPYIALAVHPRAGTLSRARLESVLFSNPKRRRRWAAAPYTPASVLAALAEYDDPRLHKRIAAHPATPADTLTQLADRYGSAEIRLALAKHPKSPAALLASLPWSTHPELRQAIGSNPNASPGMLEKVLNDATLEEQKNIARNPTATAALLLDLWQGGEDPYLRAEIAAHPRLPPQLQRTAARSPNPLLRRKLAQNPSIPDDMLLCLLADDNAGVRAAAAHSTMVSDCNPGAELNTLGNDPSRRVRRTAARSRRLDQTVLERLASDDDAWVRRWVAFNPATASGTLKQLATDVETGVRRGVARNPECPAECLHRLARDPEPWVRGGVALREGLAEKLIRQLARGERNADILSALGQNPSTPVGILLDIVRNADKDVRRSVCFNAGAPAEVLHQLLEDPYPLNRADLTRHPVLKENTLETMLADPEPQVRFGAAQALVRRLTHTRKRQESNEDTGRRKTD